LTIRGAPAEQYGNVRRLEAAVLDIARSVWNTYYAPYFGVKDSPIPSLYTHFISSSLYLKSYAVGNIIMYQLYDYLDGKISRRI
jgi:hypothetical protein